MPPDDVNRIEIGLATLGAEVKMLTAGFGEMREDVKGLRDLLSDHAEFITIFRKKCEDDEKAAARRWAITLSVVSVSLGVILYSLRDILKSIVVLLSKS